MCPEGVLPLPHDVHALEEERPSGLEKERILELWTTNKFLSIANDRLAPSGQNKND